MFQINWINRWQGFVGKNLALDLYNNCDAHNLHVMEYKSVTWFVSIIWNNNVQEAYLPKMSISGQIVSEIIAQLCLENFIQTLLNFFGSTQKKIRRVCMEISEYNWATISETIISLPQNAHFWQVGLLDVVLSEYPYKSHNFRNFIFMTSSL